MRFNRYIIIVLVFWLCITNAVGQEMTVDYRYAPDWHLSTPALPDDSYKTLVGPQGQLLYDYGGQKFYAYALGKGFKTVIHMMADENHSCNYDPEFGIWNGDHARSLFFG